MKRYFGIISSVIAPVVLIGCSASPKTFYANPSSVKDTTLCRTFMDAADKGDQQFAKDTAVEANRRGLTLEECPNKVAMENAAIVGIAAVATGVAVVAACSNGGCAGGGYSAPHSYSGSDYDCWGGGGDGPNYVRGPFRLTGLDVHGLDADGDGIACEPYQDFGS